MILEKVMVLCASWIISRDDTFFVLLLVCAFWSPSHFDQVLFVSDSHTIYSFFVSLK
jgi:hypothetical protein